MRLMTLSPRPQLQGCWSLLQLGIVAEMLAGSAQVSQVIVAHARTGLGAA